MKTASVYEVFSLLLLSVCSATLTFESATKNLELCPGQALSFRCSTDSQHILKIYLSLMNTSGNFSFVASMALQAPKPNKYNDTSLGRALNDYPESLTSSNGDLKVDIPFRKEFEGSYECKVKYQNGWNETCYINVTSRSDCRGNDGGVVMATQAGATTPATISSDATSPDSSSRNDPIQNTPQQEAVSSAGLRMSQSWYLVGLAAVLTSYFKNATRD